MNDLSEILKNCLETSNRYDSFEEFIKQADILHDTSVINVTWEVNEKIPQYSDMCRIYVQTNSIHVQIGNSLYKIHTSTWIPTGIVPFEVIRAFATRDEKSSEMNIELLYLPLCWRIHLMNNRDLIETYLHRKNIASINKDKIL